MRHDMFCAWPKNCIAAYHQLSKHIFNQLFVNVGSVSPALISSTDIIHTSDGSNFCKDNLNRG